MKRVLVYDRLILFLIHQYRTPAMNKILRLITRSGNGGAVWIIIGFCFLAVSGDFKGVILFYSSMITCALVNNLLIKSLFMRKRPCDRFTRIPLLIKRPCGSSFPSGHTAVSFACASVLWYLSVPAGIAALVLAAVIGYTRIYFFVHFPSDVLFGVISGVSSTLLVISLSNLVR